MSKSKIATKSEIEARASSLAKDTATTIRSMMKSFAKAGQAIEVAYGELSGQMIYVVVEARTSDKEGRTQLRIDKALGLDIGCMQKFDEEAYSEKVYLEEYARKVFREKIAVELGAKEIPENGAFVPVKLEYND